MNNALLTQSEECLSYKQEAVGSSPTRSTKDREVCGVAQPGRAPGLYIPEVAGSNPATACFVMQDAR